MGGDDEHGDAYEDDGRKPRAEIGDKVSLMGLMTNIIVL